MSHPRPPGQTPEAAALATITSDRGREATMDVVVSCSVATALLELKARYWGESPSKEKLEQQLEECLHALRALQTHPEYAAYKTDLDFIIEKTKEPSSDLDKVSLYFPEEKSQLSVSFPLKEVLPLVWEATNDNTQFMHNYEKIKNEQEKLAAAKNDLSNRTLTFLNRLKALRAGICHHGVRNELVLTLNGTYKGIDILEDARATISYFLKNKINEGFWKQYQETKEENKKNSLMSALFTWINNNNPREVLALIDPDDKLRRELHQLFIRHHIDPNYIQLDERIKEAFSSLEFECDTSEEHTVLRMINKIMNSLELDEGSPRNKALLATQEWIGKNYREWKNENFRSSLSTFYSFYFTHQALSKDQILLVLAGKEEETKQILNTIQGYFQQWQTHTTPPPVPLETKQTVEALRVALNKIKKDTMQPEIASFFALWENAHSENDEEQIKKQYNLLIHDVFQSKVLLSEEEIQAFNRSLREAEASGSHKDLGPYEVNRFFLQAHIQKPQDWTLGFAAAFHEVLAFIKHLPEGGGISSALKKDSYPPALLDQLSYREALYLSRQPDAPPLDQQRPKNWLYPLPEEVQTAEEWLAIAALVDEQKRNVVYQQQAVLINRLLKQSLEKKLEFSHFTALLKTVPNEHLANFFKTLGPEVLDTFLKRWEFRRLLFSEERASSYLDALGPAYFKSAIRSVSELWEWERDLPSAAAINHLLKTIGLDHIKGLIKNDKDWLFVFERLTPEYQRILINNTDKAILESKEVAEELASVAPVSSSQPTLFKPTTPKETLALHLEVHKFLQHVVLGEQKEAEDMVKAKPQLLRMKTEVTNYSGQRIEQTAYQLALGADDDDMAAMLVPYFNQLEQGQAEKERQEQEQFPNGIEDKQKEEADLSALKEVVAAIENSGSEEACEPALQKFRDYLKPKEEPIRKGKHFNIQLLVEAFKLYDEKFDALGGYNSPKNNLFWRKVIGYTQRYLPACYAQAFCQGLYDLVDRKVPLKRSLEFQYDRGYFFFPLSYSSGLGYEGVGQDGAVRARGGCCAGRRFLTKLCGAKTSALRELMQRPDKPSKNQCAVM